MKPRITFIYSPSAIWKTLKKIVFYKSFKGFREYGLWTETILIFFNKNTVEYFSGQLCKLIFWIIVHNSKTSKRVNDGKYFDPTSLHIFKWWIKDFLCQTYLNLWLTEHTFKHSTAGSECHT